MTDATLTPAQRNARDKGIGSSDAAAACGLSPWKSRAQLWAEKTGRMPPPDLDDLEHIRFGRFQENSIAKWCAEARGLKIQRWGKPYVEGCMVANIDRLIVGTDGIIECKNVSEWQIESWEGPEHSRGPLYYRIQGHHQIITAKKRFCILAAFVGGNKYRDCVIDYDIEIAELIIAREKEFWSYVEKDEPPPVTTAEEVLIIYQADKGKAINAPADLVELHAELMRLRDDSKETDSRKDKIKDEICSYMKDAEILLGPDGQPLVTWKKTSPKKVYTNWEAIAGEFAEQLRLRQVADEEIEAVITAHSKLPQGTRQFLPKKTKDLQ